MKLDTYLTLYKNKLNVRPEPTKVLEGNTREKIHDIGLGNDFLNMIVKTWATKIKIDKWNHIKIKNFCPGKTQQ
jgi:hypothetical protein